MSSWKYNNTLIALREEQAAKTDPALILTNPNAYFKGINYVIPVEDIPEVMKNIQAYIMGSRDLDLASRREEQAFQVCDYMAKSGKNPEFAKIWAEAQKDQAATLQESYEAEDDGLEEEYYCTCPECGYQFVVSSDEIESDPDFMINMVYCPDCESYFELDEGIDTDEIVDPEDYYALEEAGLGKKLGVFAAVAILAATAAFASGTASTETTALSSNTDDTPSGTYKFQA